jgi:hypothetical protein
MPIPPASRRARLLIVAVLAGVALLAAVAWYVKASGEGLPTSVPSCSWPLKVRGPATSEQAGLLRCYLRALAAHDSGGLLAVADTSGAPIRIITRADFTHAADARAGTATATFTPDQTDIADVTVTISFADQGRQTVDMHIANPSSAHSWRLDIGTTIGPSGPPPATGASP